MKALLEKYALLPLLLLCGFYTYQAVDFPLHDYANYYFGGKFLGQGRFSEWIYFPYEFNKAIAAEGFRNIFASYAPNTPFLALVFLPFSFLDLAVSKLIFNGISVLLFLYTLRRIVDFYKVKPIYLWLVPLVFFVPIKNNLLFGQVYFLLFFLLGETWIAYKRNEKFKTALLFSFAVLLKIFPIALVFLFLFRRKFKLLGYIGVCCAALFALSALFGGVDSWIFFAEQVLPKASNGEISEAFVPHYQSVSMLLKQLFVFDRTENPHPVLNYPLLFSALVTAFKIKLMVIGYYISKKIKLPLLAFSYWILVMMLASPYGSTYTLILLLFPFVALISNSISSWKKTIGLLLIFVSCNIPLSWFSGFKFPFDYLRLWCLLLLLILVFSLVYKKVNLWKVGAFAIVPMALVVFFKPNPVAESEYVLGKNRPILIHDFTISNQKLTYQYWTESGENMASIHWNAQSVQKLSLYRKEVFYKGNLLTHDGSHKFKPILVNGNTLVYLSDHDRGIGFFTLKYKILPKRD